MKAKKRSISRLINYVDVAWTFSHARPQDWDYHLRSWSSNDAFPVYYLDDVFCFAAGYDTL